VPIVMAGEFLFGLYFNLSFWFKLNDQTYWGTCFTVIGCIITIAVIVLFVPIYGYVACAWATVACNGIMLLLSYFVGRKRYPVPYPLRKMFAYILLAAVLFVVGMNMPAEWGLWRLLGRTLLLCVYIAIAVKTEGVLQVLRR